MVLGFILVIPYVFVSTSYKVAENALSTTMSIGAGIIGAVILAYLIELSNELKADNDKINNYNCSIQNIHLTLWQVFMCRPLSDLKGNLPNFKPFIDRQADLYISYYGYPSDYLDAFKSNCSHIDISTSVASQSTTNNNNNNPWGF